MPTHAIMIFWYLSAFGQSAQEISALSPVASLKRVAWDHHNSTRGMCHSDLTSKFPISIEVVDEGKEAPGTR
jgi:hypothetical protein